MSEASSERNYRKPSESVVYHASWSLDLHRRDGSRSIGRAELQFAFAQDNLTGERVEGLVWGQVHFHGVTAVVARGRSVLRRADGRSHLRIDLPFVDAAGHDASLRAWCEGETRHMPDSGQEPGHLLLCGADGEVLATGAVVLHMRIFLEQLALAPPPQSADTARAMAALRG